MTGFYVRRCRGILELFDAFALGMRLYGATLTLNGAKIVFPSMTT